MRSPGSQPYSAIISKVQFYFTFVRAHSHNVKRRDARGAYVRDHVLSVIKV